MAPSMSKGIVFLLSAFLMSCVVGAANQTQRCLKSLHEIEQELSSNVPPIEGWFTDNYHNVSRALFPGFNLPSLYIEVTIQFVNDTGNQTGKTISDEKPLKFTWSESCTFVSKYIGLTAMSMYSLGTILPQRRQTQLIVTVPPLCENASRNNNFNNDNEMWSYILLKLQDIAIMPNLSDPRVNTAHCVVTGHEEEQGIDYPTDWYKTSCWWMFAASVVTSIFVSWWMSLWTESKWINVSNHDKNEDNGWKIRSILVTVFLFTIISTVTTLLPFIRADHNIYSIVLFGTVISLHLILVIAFIKRQKWKCDICKLDCKCIRSWFYSFCRRVCMFPCIYQVVHHLMWVLYGGISSDPSWAIPVFLCECLAMFAPVYAICLYQKDTNQSGRLRIVGLLSVGVLSFVLIIGNIMVMSFYGHTVAVPTTGIIEVIAFAVLVWWVKKSGLDFLSVLPDSKKKKKGRAVESPQDQELSEQAIMMTH